MSKNAITIDFINKVKAELSLFEKECQEKRTLMRAASIILLELAGGKEINEIAEENEVIITHAMNIISLPLRNLRNTINLNPTTKGKANGNAINQQIA